MRSLRSWMSIGVACAGIAAAGVAQVAQAGPVREHGCLVTFWQSHFDMPPQPAPAVALPATAIVGITPTKVEEMPAQADDFVIYGHMWQKNSAELGPLGRYQLELIARRLQNVTFPVVIETSHDDKLDAARRDMVISLLGSRGMHDPKRVVVAYSEEARR
jgi:hypothetical protein